VRQLLLVKLGQRIRELRKVKGMSQEDLAEVTGLHRTYIGGVERGERNISVINLDRVARAFSITISDLVERIDQ
jgi:transcriptional regulator with XRE-family HTH domain